MKKLTLMPLIILLLGLVLVFNSCSEAVTTTQTAATTQAASEPQSGGVLKLIDIEFITGTIGYLPEVQFNAVSFLYPCIESFFSFDITGKPIGKLATSWEFSDDLKSLTFHLRKDVKFHDGSSLNAEVAKWNMDNIQAAKVSGSEAWESVNIVDEYTIRIDLVNYTSLILSDIPNLTKMVSKEAFDKNGIEWARWNPVGTGPFKFKEFKKDESIEFERFDDYWGGKPYLDGVQFMYIADHTTAELALQGGQADAMHAMSGAHLSAYALAPKGFNIVLPTCEYSALLFDTKNEDSQFSDVRVRMAIEYAIDKAKVAESVGHGYWTPVYEACSFIENGYIPDLEGRVYDPEKAKELLAEAGYPNGFSTTIYVVSHQNGDDMVAVQGYLAAVNIDVKIEAISASRWMEILFGGWTDIFRAGGTATYTDSTILLNGQWGPTATMKPSLKAPDGMTELIAKMLVESDDAKRAEMAKEATMLMYNDCTMVPLWNQPALYALSPKIHDDGILDWQLPFEWNWSKVWMSE